MSLSQERLLSSSLPHEDYMLQIRERLDEHPEGAEELSKLAWTNILNLAIGSTPLEGIYLGGRNDVLLKQEFKNPSGSHYDRVYLRTIYELNSSGYIRPGDELRDITSGSAGISLALIGSLLDYKVRLTVPEELPDNRTDPMRYFGAEVVSAGLGYVPAASAMQFEEIKRFREDPSWHETRPHPDIASSFIFERDGRRICYLNHSENELSVKSFEYLGLELAQDLQRKNISPDVALLAAGNWTTIAGIAPVLRETHYFPNIKIIAYEGRNTSGAHDNYGTSVDGLRLKYKDLSLVDEVVQVPNRLRDYMDELINSDRDIRHQLGHSSLMGLGLAKEIMEENPDAQIVTIGYDQKYRY